MFGHILRRRSYKPLNFPTSSARSYSTAETKSLGTELKASFKNSSVQLLLVLVLGSTVLNIMKEKNFQEDVLRGLEWQKKSLRELKEELASSEAGPDDVREQLRKVNDRAEVLGLKGSYFEGIDYSVKTEDTGKSAAKGQRLAVSTQDSVKAPVKFL
ncbi:unnamed protein product [Kuraishia capsulata CBS 1993]|uniref:Uncharacterized protein n=1 Tax=Kuraishia capsulata CBS 1993 TaxID=1382522 RepID=W6MQU6_9ASCO|nr:uncharacterized protein KUCA_T00005096001 [Kuraishia capsulata CBS 1993]CDK29109.1 unnamed protein product [Kuraishia capsulata CBS 1993]